MHDDLFDPKAYRINLEGCTINPEILSGLGWDTTLGLAQKKSRKGLKKENKKLRKKNRKLEKKLERIRTFLDYDKGEATTEELIEVLI